MGGIAGSPGVTLLCIKCTIVSLSRVEEQEVQVPGRGNAGWVHVLERGRERRTLECATGARAGARDGSGGRVLEQGAGAAGAGGRAQ